MEQQVEVKRIRGRVSRELKNQIVKEVQEVGVVTTVAKRHGISSKTIHNWLSADKNHDQIGEMKKGRELSKKLKETELEVEVLKALLKKTYQRWQNAETL